MTIDLAEILFTLFWLFFIALVYYLHRENKREGYPLESDRGGGVTVQGFPAIPEPKSFKLPHGGEVQAPRHEAFAENLPLRPVADHPGAPFEPTGDPMRDGVGPGSWANRANEPELTLKGQPRIVPMRTLEQFHVDSHDPDPRGMSVVGADGESAGTVTDLWIDRLEPMIVHFEVALAGEEGGKVLLPIGFAKVNRREREIRVQAIYSHQFGGIPRTASPDQVTALEEEKICAYFGAGTLYADAERQEPFL